MRRPVPGADSGRRRLVIGLTGSLCFHLALVALALWTQFWVPPVVVKKGEPLFIELPPVAPEEPGPHGTPARPPGPVIAAKPRPQTRGAELPKALPAPQGTAPRPAAPQPVAPSPPVSEPARAPEPGAVANAASPPEPEGARPAPSAQTGKEPAMPAPQTALALPKSEGLPGSPEPGGGLRRGRGGIEGEPIPLDTTDQRYTDYFDKVRQRIKANWIYPHEAGERGIGGQLVIDFAIAKSGDLEAIDLRRSSGVPVLDRYALNAVKLAQPFPPVPDSVARGVLPIKGIFTYQIVDTGLLNQFLR